MASAPLRPVGRSRGSTSYSRPCGPNWLAVLMIRWPSSLKKWLLLVVDPRAAASRSRGALGLVQKHQVEIAVIVRLAAAELAQREHDQLARLADIVRAAAARGPTRVRRPQFASRRPIVGSPHFSVSRARLARGDLLEARLGDVGQRPCVS